MTDGICFVGLDVHARKTAAAAVQLGSGEVFKAQLSGSPARSWAQPGWSWPSLKAGGPHEPSSSPSATTSCGGGRSLATSTT